MTFMSSTVMVMIRPAPMVIAFLMHRVLLLY